MRSEPHCVGRTTAHDFEPDGPAGGPDGRKLALDGGSPAPVAEMTWPGAPESQLPCVQPEIARRRAPTARACCAVLR
jgi:hypothetical protein